MAKIGNGRRNPPGMILALVLSLLPVWSRQAGGPNRVSPRILKVLMPSVAAELQLDGKKLDKTGFERTFKIPDEIVLPPGKDAVVLTAIIKPNNYTTITRTQRVAVSGLADIVADLREEDPHRPDRIFIRYVATPLEIVNAMLKMAAVGPKDTVYDLGCGDGRLVIDAVEWYNAKRGVGIDLDPARIKECLENARAEGVEGRVEFRQGDVLDIKDFSDADVVLLFLGQDINLALRPVLQKTLKPGSRVVSSYFTMGTWTPNRSENVRADDGTVYPLHLWVIK